MRCYSEPIPWSGFFAVGLLSALHFFDAIKVLAPVHVFDDEGKQDASVPHALNNILVLA